MTAALLAGSRAHHIRGTMRSLLTTALAALALSACATREGFDARTSALVGRSEVDLVAALGVPARTYDAEGRRFLQYEERRLITYPGSPGFYGRYGRYLGGGFPPSVETRACDLTFELRDGRVVGFNARGNNCVAPEPGSAPVVS